VPSARSRTLGSRSACRPPHLLPDRLAVVYLIFNEGYGGRGDLASEAIRLDRVEDARAAYGRALELVHSDAERRLLEARLAELA
jgi:RNA polymerase sigma-70 factor (ECF subfamily)